MKLLFLVFVIFLQSWALSSGIPVLKKFDPILTLPKESLDDSAPVTPVNGSSGIELSGIQFTLPELSPSARLSKPIPTVGYESEIKAYPESYEDLSQKVIEKREPFHVDLPELKRVRTSQYVKEPSCVIQRKLNRLRGQSQLFVQPSYRETLHDGSYIAFPTYQPANVPDLLPEPDPLDPFDTKHQDDDPFERVIETTSQIVQQMP